MLSNRVAAANPQEIETVRKKWVRPEVRRIRAGSAEAISRDGQPDGGGPGQSRS
jgi:hypothetical protein